MTASRSDLRDALAYVYRREGEDPIPAEELQNLVSFDLRWFSPGEARAFVERAQAAGLVDESEGGLVPAFDVEEPDLSVSFEPSLDLDPVEPQVEPDEADAEADEGGDLVGRVAEALAEATEWSRAEAGRAIADERERLGDLVADEAAALLMARKRGLDVDRWVDEASEDVRARLVEE
jgi:hypothetical protein